MSAQPVSTTGQTSNDPVNLMSLLGGVGGAEGVASGGGVGGLESLLGGLSDSATVAPSATTAAAPPVMGVGPAVPGVCVCVRERERERERERK